MLNGNGLNYILSGQLQKDINKVLNNLATVMGQLTLIYDEEQTMTMSVSDLDNAIAQLSSEVTSLESAVSTINTTSTQLVTDVEALAAKVSPDLTNEVNNILAQVQSLQSVASTVATAQGNVYTADQDAGGTEAPPSPPSS